MVTGRGSQIEVSQITYLQERIAIDVEPGGAELEVIALASKSGLE